MKDSHDDGCSDSGSYSLCPVVRKPEGKMEEKRKGENEKCKVAVAERVGIRE